MIKGISSALFSIFSEGKYADKVVPLLLKAHPSWGSRDRRFVAENTYDIVRYWRYYWHILGSEPIIEHDSLIKLVGLKLKIDGYTLPPTPTFDDLPEINPSSGPVPEEIRLSYPSWLYQLCASQLGDRWLNEAKALNEAARVYLRVNVSKISIAKAVEEFRKTNIEVTAHPELPCCLILDSRQPISNHPLFQRGFVEIQDAGSQLIATYLQPTTSSLIVDACAGAGGKTLHLADLTFDKARIISLDTEAWKLKNLLFRANKSGFKSISTNTLPDEEFFKNYAQKADFVLLDVPCSGLGVIKRNPDTKWKLSAEKLEALQKTQAFILQEYTKLLRPGGQLVYATCSILPIENEIQVGKFLSENPDFTLISDHHQWPSSGTDGFYMALLQRR